MTDLPADFQWVIKVVLFRVFKSRNWDKVRMGEVEKLFGLKQYRKRFKFETSIRRILGEDMQTFIEATWQEYKEGTQLKFRDIGKPKFEWSSIRKMSRKASTIGATGEFQYGIPATAMAKVGRKLRWLQLSSQVITIGNRYLVNYKPGCIWIV